MQAKKSHKKNDRAASANCVEKKKASTSSVSSSSSSSSSSLLSSSSSSMSVATSMIPAPTSNFLQTPPFECATVEAIPNDVAHCFSLWYLEKKRGNETEQPGNIQCCGRLYKSVKLLLQVERLPEGAAPIDCRFELTSEGPPGGSQVWLTHPGISSTPSSSSSSSSSSTSSSSVLSNALSSSSSHDPSSSLHQHLPPSPESPSSYLRAASSPSAGDVDLPLPSSLATAASSHTKTATTKTSSSSSVADERNKRKTSSSKGLVSGNVNEAGTPPIDQDYTSFAQSNRIDFVLSNDNNAASVVLGHKFLKSSNRDRKIFWISIFISNVCVASWSLTVYNASSETRILPSQKDKPACVCLIVSRPPHHQLSSVYSLTNNGASSSLQDHHWEKFIIPASALQLRSVPVYCPQKSIPNTNVSSLMEDNDVERDHDREQRNRRRSTDLQRTRPKDRRPSESQIPSLATLDIPFPTSSSSSSSVPHQSWPPSLPSLNPDVLQHPQQHQQHHHQFHNSQLHQVYDDIFSDQSLYHSNTPNNPPFPSQHQHHHQHPSFPPNQFHLHHHQQQHQQQQQHFYQSQSQSTIRPHLHPEYSSMPPVPYFPPPLQHPLPRLINSPPLSSNPSFSYSSHSHPSSPFHPDDHTDQNGRRRDKGLSFSLSDILETFDHADGLVPKDQRTKSNDHTHHRGSPNERHNSTKVKNEPSFEMNDVSPPRLGFEEKGLHGVPWAFAHSTTTTTSSSSSSMIRVETTQEIGHFSTVSNGHLSCTTTPSINARTDSVFAGPSFDFNLG